MFDISADWPKNAKNWYPQSLAIPYSLDQTPLSISRRSRIIATPPEVLNEIVAALE
jgi:hypothetical protein